MQFALTDAAAVAAAIQEFEPDQAWLSGRVVSLGR